MANQVFYIGPANTIEEALSRMHRHTGHFAMDTETVSTKDTRCIGVGIAWSAVEGIYFAAWPEEGHPHSRSPLFDHVRLVAARPEIKEFWNVSFDLDVLEPDSGIGLEPTNWQDASIASRIQGLPNSLAGNAAHCLGIQHEEIADLLRRLYGVQDPETSEWILPKGKTMLDVPFAEIANKCVHDCMVTWKLWEDGQYTRWLGKSEGYEWRDYMGHEYDVTHRMIEAYQLDRRLIPILRRMGKKGLKIHRERTLAHYYELAEEKFRYEGICRQQFGFNPGSNQQTGFVLASRGNFLPFTKPKKGQPQRYKQLSVAEDELLKLTDPLAHIVLQYRKRADQLSDVVEPYLGKPKGDKKTPFRQWPQRERVGSHWRIDLATSRLASYDDNLQNKTPKLRDCYEPDSGIWTWWDLSQIEMRIFAHLSQDPELLKAYERNESIHLITMHALFPGQWKYTCCERDKCTCGKTEENPLYTISKTFNFAGIYLAEGATLSKATGLPIPRCEELNHAWLAKYEGGHRFMLECMEHALDHDWIETMEGRRCALPDGSVQGWEHKGKCDINYRVQGSAAWPIKQAMVRSDGYGFDQRVQVHDEMLIDGDITDWHTGVHDTGEFTELLPGIRTPFEVYKGAIWH